MMRETINIKLLLLGVCATLPIADSKLRSRMTYHWGRVPSESCPFSSGCGGGPTSEAIKKSNRWLGINLSWSALERWAGDNPEPFLSSPRRVRPVPPEGVAECISGSIVKEQKGCHAHPFMEDGRPFVYHDRRQNKTAILCLSEKVGSSSWKQAIYKGLVGDDGPFPDLDFERTVVVHIQADYPTVEEALTNPDVPRIMLVRNPYARLLSGYKNKLELLRMFRPFGPGYGDGKFSEEDSNAGGFRAFVAACALSSMRNQWPKSSSLLAFLNKLDADPTMIASTFVKPKINWRTVNAHFKPLSQHCGLQNGMTYDFYLKTEELDDWYMPLIKLLGMEDAVSSGWEAHTKWHINPNVQPCFFINRGCADCDAMRDGFNDDQHAHNNGCGSTLATGAAAQHHGVGAKESLESRLPSDFQDGGGHEIAGKNHSNVNTTAAKEEKQAEKPRLKGAALVEHEYDAVSADLVSRLWADDLLLFGYPRFDGREGTRFKMLED